MTFTFFSKICHQEVLTEPGGTEIEREKSTVAEHWRVY
jgi:hypothetical protein